MERMNWRRIIIGSLVWAAVYSIVGGLAMLLFRGREFMLELERMGWPLHLTTDTFVFLGISGVLFTVSWGFVSVWFYAAIRPRWSDDRSDRGIWRLAALRCRAGERQIRYADSGKRLEGIHCGGHSAVVE